MTGRLGPTILLPVCLVHGCASGEDGPRADAGIARATSAVVRQIDHILIESADAAALFSLLADTLRLPVVWAMQDYGSFASGGVAVGNVNLEVLSATGPVGGNARTRFIGLALEPEPLDESLRELERRAIRHGTPRPFTSTGPDGSRITRWTTVGLPSVSREGLTVFICQYEFDVGTRRQTMLDTLRSRNGGPLSVQSVQELVIGARDADRSQREWQALLEPLSQAPSGTWPLGVGPSIQVVAAAEDGISSLVIAVSSLTRARDFLAARGWIGSEGPNELTIATPALTGLGIRLVSGG